jgi:hypothetical protein
MKLALELCSDNGVGSGLDSLGSFESICSDLGFDYSHVGGLFSHSDGVGGDLCSFGGGFDSSADGIDLWLALGSLIALGWSKNNFAAIAKQRIGSVGHDEGSDLM